MAINHSTSGHRGRVLRDSAPFFVRDSGLGFGLRASGSGFVRVCRAESPALAPAALGFLPDFGAFFVKKRTIVRVYLLQPLHKCI